MQIQFLRFVLALGLLCAGIAATACAATSADDWRKMKAMVPRGYVCGFANAAPKVDGVLDEGSWRAAPWSADFVDIEGSGKPAPRLRTRVKMLWDHEHLYLGAEVTEPHVWGTLTKHDAVIFQDNDFEVFIDPNGDNHEYFELEVNPLNTTWDLFLPKPYKDGGQADNNWELAGLKSSVHVQGTLNNPTDEDTGWTVELALPWRAFAAQARVPSPPRVGDRWRMNFSRVEWRHEVVEGKYCKVPETREDNWVWSPPGIIDMHRPERWGYVEFSGVPPAAAEFTPDPALPARDLLMEVYHCQKSFQEKNGRWATSVGELELALPDSELAKRLQLSSTAAGFTATLEDRPAGRAPLRWHVQQDSRLWSEAPADAMEKALQRAGENRGQLERALRESPAAQQGAMRFLVCHMPERDLRVLSAEFLLEQVREAYAGWEEAPWKNDVPPDIFLNNVLPYANINEQRDNWRKDFRSRFRPLVRDAKTPGLAAARLNQKLFSLVNVKYSTQRPKADQSPYESIKSGTASCTGLAILLIDACRAVGVPARFVGTPLWHDKSGNHSWVEVWDQGWHFTGAAEANGDQLDAAWFIDRASAARRDDPLHAIYAASFQRTPLSFPLAWDPEINYVSAVNVTDRYASRAAKPPAGTAKTMFAVWDAPGGQRCAATLKVSDATGAVVFEGTTNDERFDANDHVSAFLPLGRAFQVEIKHGARVVRESFQTDGRPGPFTWFLERPAAGAKAVPAPASAASATVAALTKYLAEPFEKRGELKQQAWATRGLSRAEAAEAARLLWEDHAARIRQTSAAEMKARELTAGNLKMPFAYEVFGAKPAGGRSLYISLHGGGGAPKQVNDQQWENQKRLYRLEEGVYVAPRAPTDTWDLWHQGHIDAFFDRLIENLIVLEDVDPNRVYLMGYSAGGDGVFQLAPRMADRWAAAAMMAGHPNETSPLGLRNVAFAIHVGALDAAFNRNAVAKEWEQKLGELRRNDAGGYEHSVTLHANKGHWMDREDAAAIPWMARHARQPFPTRIVWKQDDVFRARCYWLAVNSQDVKDRAEVVATRKQQVIEVVAKGASRITVRVNDDMADLDQPVSFTCQGQSLFQAKIDRTIAVLAKTLAERGDRLAVYSGETTVDLPATEK